MSTIDFTTDSTKVVDIKGLNPLNFNLDSYTELYKCYMEDISSYVKCITEGKQSEYISIARKHLFNKVLDKWIPLLGFNESKIKEDIRELQTPKVDAKSSFTLREILNEDIPILDQIVPNILNSVGLCIFGGQAKGGKSTFLYKLIYSIVMGKPFLGRPVKSGRVLFFQLEEPKYLIKKRLMLNGFGDANDIDTQLIINFSNPLRIEREFDLVNDLDWLSEIIKTWKPDIVIIDSLRKATMKANIGENTNEMGKLVYQLQQVINHAEIAGILVHHTNKTPENSKKKDNNPNRLSGHNSLAGASDGLIFLNRVEGENDSDTISQIFTKPRDGVELEIHYKIVTTEGGLAEFERVFEDTPATNPITTKIIRFLSNKAGTYFSAKGISRGIQVRFDGEFSKCLLYLQTSNVILAIFKDKSFYYKIPEDSIWIKPVNVSSEFNTPAMLDALTVISIKTKRGLRELLCTWDRGRVLQMQESLIPEEKERIRLLTNSFEFKVDDKVIYEGREHVIKSIVSEKPSFKKVFYKINNVEEPILEHNLKLVELIVEDVFEEDPLDVYTEENNSNSMDILTINDFQVYENESQPSEDTKVVLALPMAKKDYSELEAMLAIEV